MKTSTAQRHGASFMVYINSPQIAMNSAKAKRSGLNKAFVNEQIAEARKQSSSTGHGKSGFLKRAET